MKIKKGILTLVLTVITILTFAQSQHVTSAAIIFNQYNSEKDQSVKVLKIKKAKEFIDKAYNNESTSNKPKMWMVRAKIYKMIAFNHSNLDDRAIFKATESHIQCMQPHPKKKNKIIIYKKWAEEEVFTGLIQCANKLFNLAVVAYQEEKFQESLNFYEPIYDVIVLDYDGQLKSIKITTESIVYNSYLAAKAMKNNELSKDFLQHLISMNSENPSIYSSMSNIYLEEGNSDKALYYMDLGRGIFESDQGLIANELNLYMKLEKTEELIEKYTEAIALDQENDLFYFNRGTIYDLEGEFTNAEKDYKSSLELNPESFLSNYNLGALYFNAAIKEQYGSKNATKLFKEAFPYLEKAYSLEPKDINTLLSLKQLYYIRGDEVKEKEMKKLIAELKK